MGFTTLVEGPTFPFDGAWVRRGRWCGGAQKIDAAPIHTGIAWGLAGAGALPGVEDAVGRDELEGEHLVFEEGTLSIFGGWRTLHRVTPVRAGRRRLVVSGRHAHPWSCPSPVVNWGGRRGCRCTAAAETEAAVLPACGGLAARRKVNSATNTGLIDHRA